MYSKLMFDLHCFRGHSSRTLHSCAKTRRSSVYSRPIRSSDITAGTLLYLLLCSIRLQHCGDTRQELCSADQNRYRVFCASTFFGLRGSCFSGSFWDLKKEVYEEVYEYSQTPIYRGFDLPGPIPFPWTVITTVNQWYRCFDLPGVSIYRAILLSLERPGKSGSDCTSNCTKNQGQICIF